MDVESFRLLPTSYTLGIDLDEDALEVARNNLSSLDLEDSPIDFLRADLNDPRFLKIFKPRLDPPNDFYRATFDTVVMNPPFGTKNKGIDMIFLEIACRMTRCSVYSLHKTSTREFIQKRAKEYGFRAEVLAEMRYDLPKTMKMHKQKSLDIAVDFWRFQRIDLPSP